MNLIDNWKSAWRMLSVQAAVLLAALAAAYEQYPELQQILPDGWMKYAPLLVVLARVIKQPKVEPHVEDS